MEINLSSQNILLRLHCIVRAFPWILDLEFLIFFIFSSIIYAKKYNFTFFTKLDIKMFNFMEILKNCNFVV